MFTRTEVRQIIGDFTPGIDPQTSLDYARSTVDIWKTLSAVLSERKYYHEGCDIRVQVDWEPIHLLLAEELRDSLDLFSDPPPGMVREWRYVPLQPDERRIYDEETSLPAHVEISGQNEVSNSNWYPEFFVETYLYDLFLVLNLALPGSADFFNVTVHSIGHSAERLGLSSSYWWSAYQVKDQWPLLRAIDPKVVAAWFYSVRWGFAQVPETSVERAMFAMLHVCRSRGRPEDIVWLFYALSPFFKHVLAKTSRRCLNDSG